MLVYNPGLVEVRISYSRGSVLKLVSPEAQVRSRQVPDLPICLQTGDLRPNIYM